ncbi:hypothetical protein PENTCL1PPCAC_9772, partial [Pristionchus entomophagus]
MFDFQFPCMKELDLTVRDQSGKGGFAVTSDRIQNLSPSCTRSCCSRFRSCLKQKLSTKSCEGVARNNTCHRFPEVS